MKQENRLNKVFVPSKEDFRELYRLCRWEWNDERKGMTVTGPNGNSIFLPASGYRYGSSVGGSVNYGGYWSSSHNDEDFAYYLYFHNKEVHPEDRSWRYCDYSVRLVGSVPQEGLVDLGLPSGLLWGQSNVKIKRYGLDKKELFTFDEAQRLVKNVGLVKDVVKLDFEKFFTEFSHGDWPEEVVMSSAIQSFLNLFNGGHSIFAYGKTLVLPGDCFHDGVSRTIADVGLGEDCFYAENAQCKPVYEREFNVHGMRELLKGMQNVIDYNTWKRLMDNVKDMMSFTLLRDAVKTASNVDMMKYDFAGKDFDMVRSAVEKAIPGFASFVWVTPKGRKEFNEYCALRREQLKSLGNAKVLAKKSEASLRQGSGRTLSAPSVDKKRAHGKGI